MDLSEIFKYEEQEDRRYLVYEKRETDVLDAFTMEMLMRNKIDGIAAFSCTQLDRLVKMKYNVTGLKSLKEFFMNTINRMKFLTFLESFADALLVAEDYMLDLSSYVFDEEFLYVDPRNMKVYMIVLPVKRAGIPTEIFLKKMLFDVRYDQMEDCSYVASLMNFLGNETGFSIKGFKEQVVIYKNDKRTYDDKQNMSSPTASASAVSTQQGVLDISGINIPSVFSTEKVPQLKEKEEQGEIPVSLSGYAEEAPKRKRFFGKKEKTEKREKKSFFQKKREKKGEDVQQEGSIKSPLEGIAIPGMDFLGKVQERGNIENTEGKISLQRQEIPIPVQKISVPRQEVKQEDFGTTVYIGEETEAPTVFEEEKSPKQKYLLYRCSTQETFEIQGDIVRVGRSPAISEICISGNRGVGRVHAVLYIRDGQVYIADNHSKNKTFVDGDELNPDEPPKRLLSGSRIKLGMEELEFRISR